MTQRLRLLRAAILVVVTKGGEGLGVDSSIVATLE